MAELRTKVHPARDPASPLYLEGRGMADDEPGASYVAVRNPATLSDEQRRKGTDANVVTRK